MDKRTLGSSSSLFTNLSQREMSFLDMYIAYREGETGDWIPDWFYLNYDGQLRAMSPVVLTYFLAELVGRQDPYRIGSGIESKPIVLREASYDKEERRSISHREAGTPPIPLTFDGDPDPWGSYTLRKRYFLEAQRIYYKLLGKMRRRSPKDAQDCEMHAKTHLDDYDYENHSIWREVAIEGKEPKETLDNTFYVGFKTIKDIEGTTI